MVRQVMKCPALLVGLMAVFLAEPGAGIALQDGDEQARLRLPRRVVLDHEPVDLSLQSGTQCSSHVHIL